ncbi:MAG: glycosyltransferase [Prevotella sp.]|nr:glycosyltransferase [Prevotella sp.]
MKNMISVIVCTYNQEDTIARTLDSILMQQCHVPFEIIIGEDCSTDRTGDICREYAKKHPEKIKLFTNPHNKGVIDNYFDCLLAAQGDYIADCAGDDFWVDNQKLEKEINIMESDDSITLVHTAWRSYNEHTKEAKDSPQQPFPAPITDGKTMLEAILTQTNMPVIQLCSSLYRADIIQKAHHDYNVLFRGQGIVCEDLQIAFFEALNGNIAYLPDVTLHYSQGEDTISSPKDIRKLFDFYKKATTQSWDIAETFGIKSKTTEKFFSQRTFAMLMHAFRAHDSQMRNEALDCKKQWGVKNNFAILMVKSITACESIWDCTLVVRKIFIKLKK